MFKNLCFSNQFSSPGYFLALIFPHVWGPEVTNTDTRDLHTDLSITHWTHSATGTPVILCLMSSVQCLRGLPRRLLPAMMPCRICVHRLLARTTWPKYCSFLLLTSARKLRVGCSSSSTSVFCPADSHHPSMSTSNAFVFIQWFSVSLLGLYRIFYSYSIRSE